MFAVLLLSPIQNSARNHRSEAYCVLITLPLHSAESEHTVGKAYYRRCHLTQGVFCHLAQGLVASGHFIDGAEKLPSMPPRHSRIAPVIMESSRVADHVVGLKFTLDSQLSSPVLGWHNRDLDEEFLGSGLQLLHFDTGI